MPEISIIVPVYNTQQFLNKCVNSLLNQSFSDFELILINDGSTDLSAFYCKAFAQRDSRIRTLDIPHSGLAAAHLAGIKAAQGRYIGFVDSDDWVEKDFLSHLYAAVTCNHADIAMCASGIEKTDGFHKGNLPVECGVYAGDTLNALKHSQMMCRNDRSHAFVFSQLWDKLFRREILLANAGYLDTRRSFGEDALPSWACILDSQRLCLIDYADYHYLLRKSSLIHQLSKAEDRMEQIKNYWTSLRKMLCEKGYSDLTYKADALGVYALAMYSGDNCGVTQDPDMMEMVRAQSETDGCEEWRNVLKKVRTFTFENI